MNFFEAMGIFGPFIINTSAVPKKLEHSSGELRFIINLDFAKSNYLFKIYFFSVEPSS